MNRHFIMVKDFEGHRERYSFQANKLGHPENEAAAAALRKLHRTNKNIEVEVYIAVGPLGSQEEGRYVGKACWDPTGSVKKFVRALAGCA